MKVNKIAVSLIAATMAFSVSVTSVTGYMFNNVISVSAATYLKKNSSGSEVTQLQNNLIALNYMKTGAATGTFDQSTDDAVKKIQSDYGLSVDGIVGPDTLGLINGLIDGTAQIIEVIGTNVNIRSGAGTSYSKLTVANKGQKYTCSSYKTVNGVKWYSIKVQNKTGYICGTYVSVVNVTSSGSTSQTTTSTNSNTTTSATASSSSSASGKLTVKGDVVNVRSGAGTSYSKVTTVKKSQSYSYSNVKSVNGVKWYYITVNSSSKGWICGTYVTLTASTTTTTAATTTTATTASKLTVKGDVVNVRSGAGTSYSKVTTVKKGQSYSYSSVKSVSGVNWYYITVNSSTKGWICGTYVSLTTSATTTTTAAANTTGKVAVKGDVVNVRSGAGTSYSKVTTVKKGQSYSYSNVKSVSGVNWYYITVNSSTKGWICGTYVTATPSSTTTSKSTTTSNSTTTTTTKASVVSPSDTTTTVPQTTTTTAPPISSRTVITGTVKVSTKLNVRSGKGTSYTKLGTLSNGTKVVIVEKGSTWHKIEYGSGYGYVSASYITNIKTTVEPVSLSYSTDYYYVNKGETIDVSLSVSGATIAYASSDLAKCPVSSNGVVTGQTEGLYEITATCGSSSATTCVVVLREPYTGISAMKISAAGTKFIADWEGGGTVISTGETVFYPYQDVSGYWTIGYGHAKTTTASKSWSEERAIAEFNNDIEAMIGAEYKLTDDKPYLSQEGANKLLNADLNDGSYVKAVSDWAIRNGVKLTQNQFDALTSFCYNLGPSYWTSDSTKFYLKSAIISYRSGSDANPEQIIEGFCRYMKSSGKNYKGLWYRRRNEAEMFIEGDYAIDRENKFTLPSDIAWA